MSIIFTVPGRISGKERPRFGRGRTYTPAKTAKMEAVVKQFGAAAMMGGPPLEGPLSLEIDIYLSKPKSWSKKKKDETLWATGTPDLDNIAKLIGDALQGTCFANDSQIAALSIMRRYSVTDTEGTVITIRDARKL